MQSDIDAQLTSFFEETPPRDFAKVMRGYDPHQVDEHIRQLATESAVLSIVGGGLGVLLATAIVPLLWSLVPAELPTNAIPSVDGRVITNSF